VERSGKQFHYEWGVAGAVLATVSSVAHWLILGGLEPLSLAMLLLFTVGNFWQGYRELNEPPTISATPPTG
jgi:hypothetical protein